MYMSGLKKLVCMTALLRDWPLTALEMLSLCWAGWWAETGAWVPRDWALRPGYDTRVAIINALYACGENIQKLMPVLLTEAVRRDRWALSLPVPHSPVSRHTAWQGAAHCTAAQQRHTCVLLLVQYSAFSDAAAPP